MAADSDGKDSLLKNRAGQASTNTPLTYNKRIDCMKLKSPDKVIRIMEPLQERLPAIRTTIDG
jgi:hypothetical protein